VVFPTATLLAISALLTFLTGMEYMNSAKADLVANGGFESTTNGAGQLGFNTNAADWTVAAGGYDFIFASGAADTTGAIGQYGALYLWGPNNGSANGMPASSPVGGNYVAADGAYDVGAISQTINGLTAGQHQTFNFTADGTSDVLSFLGTRIFGFDVRFFGPYGRCSRAQIRHLD
jgi:hypothetical protein